MRGIKCVAAGFAAAIALGLSSPQTMAQGLLTIEPHPFDSTMSPYPLGPLRKIRGDLCPDICRGFRACRRRLCRRRLRRRRGGPGPLPPASSSGHGGKARAPSHGRPPCGHRRIDKRRAARPPASARSCRWLRAMASARRPRRSVFPPPRSTSSKTRAATRQRRSTGAASRNSWANESRALRRMIGRGPPNDLPSGRAASAGDDRADRRGVAAAVDAPPQCLVGNSSGEGISASENGSSRTTSPRSSVTLRVADNRFGCPR